jgi:hypothetical protein
MFAFEKVKRHKENIIAAGTFCIRETERLVERIKVASFAISLVTLMWITNF